MIVLGIICEESKNFTLSLIVWASIPLLSYLHIFCVLFWQSTVCWPLICLSRLPIWYLRIWNVYPGSQIRIFPSRIPDPGSKRFRIQGQKDPGSGCASKNLRILTPKTVSKLSEKWSVMLIPDPVFFHPGSGGQKSGGFPDPDPQHWFEPRELP